MRPRLVTIPLSHYCEKARWALDRAGVAYDERCHLQLFHLVPARLAAGRSSAPALVADDARLADSTDILTWADRRAALGLYAHPDALALEEELDERLGPATRRIAYHHLMTRRELLAEFNNRGAPAFERWIFPLVYPLARAILTRRLGITQDAVDGDVRNVRAVFDELGQRLADGRRWLLGDAFSAADLTFAALAAPLLVPEEYGARLPPVERLPDVMQLLVAELRATAAGRYALRLYRDERRPRAAVTM